MSAILMSIKPPGGAGRRDPLGREAKREPATLGLQSGYGVLSVPTLRPTLTSYTTAAVPEKRGYAPRKPTQIGRAHV